MKPKKMNYVMAEFAYCNYLRDNGHNTEIEYPCPETSTQSSDGQWLLVNKQGNKLATVYTNGRVYL